MRKDIHPNYYPDAQVVCACGNTWTTGSTRKTIRTEVCSKCHPFFTGQQQRLIDIEGQVDRFYKKIQAREDFVNQKVARAQERTSPDRPISDLELGTRALAALDKADLKTFGAFLAKLAEGEEAVLAVEGFGRKSLIDAKKKLRALGYEIPETAGESAE